MQNSGPWDPWLPVVENSRLVAQRAHSAAPMYMHGLHRPRGLDHATYGLRTSPFMQA